MIVKMKWNYLLLGLVCLCVYVNAQTDPLSAHFCVHKNYFENVKESEFTLSCYASIKKIDDSITYHGREIGESIVAHIQSEDSLVLSHDSKFGAYTYLSGGVANYKNQIVIDKIPVNLELMSFHLFSKDSLFIRGLFNHRYFLIWNFYHSADSLKQTFSGRELIDISGFCTEEQLKIIREWKKRPLYSKKIRK